MDCVLFRSPHVYVVIVKALAWSVMRGKIEISKNSPVATVDSHSRSVKIGGDSSHHLSDNVDTSSVDCRTHGTQVPRCDQTGARGAISIVCASDGERRSSTPYLKGLTTPPIHTNLPCKFRLLPSFPSSAPSI